MGGTHTCEKPAPDVVGSLVEQVISGCETLAGSICHKIAGAMTPSETPDYYLLNRPDRPKFDIAQYIHFRGFSVPRCFSDTEELLRLPLEDYPVFLLRSEHPQDYDGRSGDLPSWEIRRKDHGIFEVYSEGIRKYNVGQNIDDIIASYIGYLKDICTTIGLDPEQASYSVWEYIPGDNYAIVADTGVSGRYHIYERKRSQGNAYKVFDIDAHDILSPLYRKLISLYEKIRNLERFDPKNCPIMEFQHGSPEKDEQDIYFLQYLRTRNGTMSDWKLEREMEPGEIKAQFVRGVTPPEGIVIRFDTKQFRFFADMRELCEPQEHNEGYVFSSLTAGSSRRDNTLNHSIESLIQGYKTICMVIDRASERLKQSDIWKILEDHAGRSFIHKPEISIAIDDYDGNILFPGLSKSKEQVYVRIVADGTNAYLKRVDVMG